MSIHVDCSFQTDVAPQRARRKSFDDTLDIIRRKTANMGMMSRGSKCQSVVVRPGSSTSSHSDDARLSPSPVSPTFGRQNVAVSLK